MRLFWTLVVVVFLIGCDDNGQGRRDLPGDDPTGNPTAPTPAPAVTTFEFRVLGSADNVRRADIRWSTTQDGTSLLTTTLPWTATVRTTDTSSFLSLTARQTSFENTGLILIQILVNGRVFREAIADGPDAQVSVAGTYAQ